MSYWCDDAALGREQRRLDARQQEARERMQSKTLGEAIANGNWQVREEANRTFSAYQGLAFRKGGFRDRGSAQAWMDEHLTKMMEVGAA